LHTFVYSFNPWDILLVIVISVQATVLAYLPQPRWKAFALSLPVPFTLMVLAAGRPIDVTNVLGLFLLLLFTHGVRWLHYELRLPIIPAIVLSTLGYCVVGTLAAPLLPRTDAAFWIAWVFVVVLGIYLILRLPERVEPDYRPQLPVWIKLPVIAVVVIFLILLRNTLQGFATVFPMVGVIAAYEGRYCLWTIGRQIPVIMVSMGMMMAAVYLTQQQLGLPLALLAGWVVFLLVFGSITLRMWSRAPQAAQKTVAGIR
jgi:hypothetical protein